MSLQNCHILSEGNQHYYWQSLAKMQGVEKEKSSNYYKSCLNVEVDVINVVYV